MNSEPLKAGDRIKLAEHGEGVVVQVDRKWAIVAIDRYGELQLRVSAKLLTRLVPVRVTTADQFGNEDDTHRSAVLEPSVAAVGPEVKENVAETLPGAGLAARQAIEALRFGIVPEPSLRELTVGFDRMAGWINGVLAKAEENPQIAEVCGAFGTGKSHSMALVRAVSREERWVTARVEVDGAKVTLADPAPFLYALTATIRGRKFDTATPVVDLFAEAGTQKATVNGLQKLGATRAADNLRVVKSLRRIDKLDFHSEELDGFLSGADDITATNLIAEIKREPEIDPYDITLKRPIGLRVADRPHDFVMALASLALLARFAGFKGFVLTIDEFEVESNLSSQQRKRFASNLALLVDYLQDPVQNLGVAPAPLALFVATVGGEEDMGQQILAKMVEVTDGERMELVLPTRTDQEVMAKAVAAVYAQAYGVSTTIDPRKLTDTVFNRIGHGSTESGRWRAFVKHLVGLLDAEYGPCP